MGNITLRAFCICVLGFVSSCQPSRFTAAGSGVPEGYTSVLLAADTYYVSFLGNANTPYESSMKYVLYRAAQIADSTKHDYFVVMDDAYLGFYGSHPSRSNSGVSKVIKLFSGTPAKDNASAFESKMMLNELSTFVNK
jgi:hypothetical protein